MKNPRNYQIHITTVAEKRAACELLSKLTGLPIYPGTNFDYIDGYSYYGVSSSNDCICGIRNVLTAINFADIPKMLLEIYTDPSVQVVLNDAYTASVSKQGITVECQTFPLSVVTSLAEAVKKVQSE